jgi:hypothetical protein
MIRILNATVSKPSLRDVSDSGGKRCSATLPVKAQGHEEQRKMMSYFSG